MWSYRICPLSFITQKLYASQLKHVVFNVHTPGPARAQYLHFLLKCDITLQVESIIASNFSPKKLQDASRLREELFNVHTSSQARLHTRTNCQVSEVPCHVRPSPICVHLQRHRKLCYVNDQNTNTSQPFHSQAQKLHSPNLVKRTV